MLMTWGRQTVHLRCMYMCNRFKVFCFAICSWMKCSVKVPSSSAMLSSGSSYSEFVSSIPSTWSVGFVHIDNTSSVTRPTLQIPSIHTASWNKAQVLGEMVHSARDPRHKYGREYHRSSNDFWWNSAMDLSYFSYLQSKCFVGERALSITLCVVLCVSYALNQLTFNPSVISSSPSCTSFSSSFFFP